MDNLINATPWPWYVARAAGLVGFIFLWLSVFLGLAIKNPILKKMVAPIYSFSLHCFLSAMAVFWALVHGTSLLFDKQIYFGLADVAVPFLSKTTVVNVTYLGLGILAFYCMVILTITSYLRRHLNNVFWRIIHFLNPLIFIFTVAHGLVIGTDMRNIWMASIFMGFSTLLAILYLTSLISIIVKGGGEPQNNFQKNETDYQN